MPKIFISYRRADSRKDTGRIYDRLSQAFGKGNLFMDIDNIPLGRDFRGVLREAIAQTDALLVIIGRQWVNVTDENGHRRLDNPADFVRIELESGLQRDTCLVVPILVDGAPMPRADELPDSLRELAFKNAIIVRDDPDFNNDVTKLIAGLRNYFSRTPKLGVAVKPTSRANRGWIAALAAFVALVILGAIGVLFNAANQNNTHQTATAQSLSFFLTEVVTDEVIPTDLSTASLSPTNTLTLTNTPPLTDTPTHTDIPTDESTDTPNPSNTPSFTPTSTPTIYVPMDGTLTSMIGSVQPTVVDQFSTINNLWFRDFTDERAHTTSNWENRSQVLTIEASLEVQNGALQTFPSAYSLSSNYFWSLEFAPSPLPETGGYGVALIDAALNYYTFILRLNNTWGLAYLPYGSTWQTLYPYRSFVSETFDTRQPHTLGVLVTQDNLVFYVDGTEMASVSNDGTDYNTRPVLEVGRGESFAVTLDNLVVWTLGSISIVTATMLPTPTSVSTVYIHCSVEPLNDAVNVRSAPSTEAGIMYVLPRNSGTAAYEQALDNEGETWWRLLGGGWVRADSIREYGDCNLLPQVEG
jgi:hypothetical protein